MVLMNLFAGQQARHVENRLMDTMGRGEEGRVGDTNMETYTAICKIGSQWEFAV